MRRLLSRIPAWALPVAAGGALLALFYGGLARPGELLALRDVPRFHLPLRAAFAAALGDGLPSWNPAIHGGQPILSNPNYAAFYPPTWLGLVLAPHVALHVILLLHAAFGFAGAWRLARRLGCAPPAALVAAIGFACGGAAVGAVGTVTVFSAFCWMPWILGWGDALFETPRGAPWARPAARLAAGLALQFLAGEPMTVLATALGLACLALARRPAAALPRLARLAAAGLAAMALAAVQLVPTLVRLAGTARAGGLAAGEATTWSTPPERLVEWALPAFFGDPMRADEGLYFGWGIHDLDFPYLMSIYPGLLVLVLAFAALLRWPVPRRTAWAAMIAVAVVLALGRHNPLLAAVIEGLPALRVLRYPEKFLLLASAAMPFAAALGWQHLLERRRAGRGEEADLPAALAAVVAAIALVLLAALVLRPDLGAWLARRGAPLPPPPEVLAAAAPFLAARAALAAGGAALAAGLLVAHRWRRPPHAALLVLLPALVAADLWLNGRGLLPTVPADSVLRAPAVAAALPGDVERVFSDAGLTGEPPLAPPGERPVPAALWRAVERVEPYLGTLWGLAYVLDEDTDRMLTTDAAVALAALHRAWPDLGAVRRLAGAWSADRLLLTRPLPALLAARLRGRPDRLVEVLPSPERLPVARVAPAVRFHPDRETALAAALADGLHPARLEHWVGGPAGALRSAPGAALDMVERRAGRLELAARAPGELLAVVAITWDAGWRAAIDGRPSATHPTALGQIGLRVPAGDHRVTLIHRERALAPAAALSAAAWLAAAALFARGRRDPQARLES